MGEKETAEEFWNKLSEEEKEKEENLKEYWHKVAEEEREKERIVIEEKLKKEEEKKGSFVIRIGKYGVIASHLITLKGVSEDRWYKPFLIDFIKKMVETEINEFWQAEIELLNVSTEDLTEIEVAVYIAGVGESKTIKQWTREWLENHIGNLFHITNLEVKAVSSLARISDGE